MTKAWAHLRTYISSSCIYILANSNGVDHRKMPINIALLGSGLFAQNAYLPALSPSSEINLHTVWSRSQKSVEALVEAAKKLGLSPSQTLYGDDNVEKLLDDPTIDAVIIVLPITKQPIAAAKQVATKTAP